MSLSAKLITALLACGLIPLGVVAYVGYNTADEGMDNISSKGSTELEQKAYNQLVALRDVKKTQIQKYFGEGQRRSGAGTLGWSSNRFRGNCCRGALSVHGMPVGIMMPAHAEPHRHPRKDGVIPSPWEGPAACAVPVSAPRC